MITPHGTRGQGPRGPELHLERRYAAPIDTVWAAVTESDRLARWIGRWERDAAGDLIFYMTAEGDDVEGEKYTILECTPPNRLSVDTSVGENTWHLRLELERDGDGTILRFAQVIADDDMGNVGPGWEYYLDRLGAVLADRNPSAVSWDDYYPAMRAYYSALSRDGED